MGGSFPERRRYPQAWTQPAGRPIYAGPARLNGVFQQDLSRLLEKADISHGEVMRVQIFPPRGHAFSPLPRWSLNPSPCITENFGDMVGVA